MPNMSMQKNPMPEQAPEVRNKNFDEVALGYTPEMAMMRPNAACTVKTSPASPAAR